MRRRPLGERWLIGQWVALLETEESARVAEDRASGWVVVVPDNGKLRCLWRSKCAKVKGRHEVESLIALYRMGGR